MSRKVRQKPKEQPGDWLPWRTRTLTSEDWDFRPEKCFEVEVQECFFYEFAREVGAFRDAVERSRKTHPDFRERYAEAIRSKPTQLFPKRLSDVLPKSPSDLFPLAYTMIPDWPDKAFLSLDKGKRRYWLLPHSAQRPTVLDHESLLSIAAKVVAEPDSVTPHGTIWKSETEAEVVAFSIPWKWPPTLIETAFKNWLAANRPKGAAGDSRPPVTPAHGRAGAGAWVRLWRPRLKALGAYRVWLHFNGNRAKMDVQLRDTLTKVLGRNFAHDSAWSEARETAHAARKFRAGWLPGF